MSPQETRDGTDRQIWMAMRMCGVEVGFVVPWYDLILCSTCGLW